MRETARKSKLLKQTINLKDEKLGTCSTNNEEGFNDYFHMEDGKNHQLFLYDPTAVADKGTSSSRRNSVTNQSPKVSPYIEAFSVQCANCFKWRIIPTMEKYEEIRELISDKPFLCEAGQQWKPEISCDDPPDIEQDDSRVWAIDKPNIPRPPPGWQRILKVRGEGGTRFADVFYTTPCGKKLRSLVEVQRFLKEHAEYVEEGAHISKFSFQIPTPLQEKHVQNRTSRSPKSGPRLSEAKGKRLGMPLSSQDHFGLSLSNLARLKKRVAQSKLRSNAKLVDKQSKHVGALFDGSANTGIGLDIREEIKDGS